MYVYMYICLAEIILFMKVFMIIFVVVAGTCINLPFSSEVIVIMALWPGQEQCFCEGTVLLHRSTFHMRDHQDSFRMSP